MNFDSLGGILDEFDRQVNGAKDARMMKFFILLAVLVIIVVLSESPVRNAASRQCAASAAPPPPVKLCPPRHSGILRQACADQDSHAISNAFSIICVKISRTSCDRTGNGINFSKSRTWSFAERRRCSASLHHKKRSPRPQTVR